MRRIALVNQKGGVGKTTTAVNLGAGLARLGRRVILVDVDPQANATLALGLTSTDVETSIYEVMRGGAKASAALIERVPNLLLLPSSLDLAGIEMELAQTIGRETILRDALRELTEADILLIDCPPSLGLLNINALTAVEEVFIPLQCEFFALQGIAMLTRTIGLVQRRLNPTLKTAGVIPCMYDARKGLAREVVAEIERHFGQTVFKTRVRTNVRLAEAPSHGKTIFEYAPDSHGAADYLALAREVVGLPPETPAVEADGVSRDAGAAAAPTPPQRSAPQPASDAPTSAPAASDPPVKTTGAPAGVAATAQPPRARKSKPKTIPPAPAPAQPATPPPESLKAAPAADAARPEPEGIVLPAIVEPRHRAEAQPAESGWIAEPEEHPAQTASAAGPAVPGPDAPATIPTPPATRPAEREIAPAPAAMPTSPEAATPQEPPERSVATPAAPDAIVPAADSGPPAASAVPAPVTADAEQPTQPPSPAERKPKTVPPSPAPISQESSTPIVRTPSMPLPPSPVLAAPPAPPTEAQSDKPAAVPIPAAAAQPPAPAQPLAAPAPRPTASDSIARSFAEGWSPKAVRPSPAATPPSPNLAPAPPTPRATDAKITTTVKRPEPAGRPSTSAMPPNGKPSKN